MTTSIPDMAEKLETIDPNLHFVCRLCHFFGDGKTAVVVNGTVLAECDTTAEALEFLARVCEEVARRFAPESIKV